MKSFELNILLKVNYFLIGLLLFITPLFFLPDLIVPFITTKTFVFMFITEVLFFLYLYLVFFYYEDFKPKKSYILYSFLIFILVSILSGILGKYPLFSFWSSFERTDGLILLIHIFLFFLVVVSTVRSKKIIDILIWVSSCSAVLVALSVYLGPSGTNLLPSILGYTTRGGLVGNDSYTGGYLLFNLFFILYLFLETKKRYLKYILGLFFIFIVFSPIFFNFDIFKGLVSLKDLIKNPTILLGSARAAAIGIILGFFFFFLLSFVKNRKKKVRYFFGFFTTFFIAALFLTVFCLTFYNSSTMVGRWFGEKTNNLRYVYWSQVFSGFKESPVFGWGYGNFGMVNEKYFNPDVFTIGDGSERFADKPHNNILEILCTGGILGLLAYIGLYVSFLFLLLSSKNISFNVKKVFLALFLAYFLHNLVFFDYTLSWLMFIFSISIIVIIDKDNDEVPRAFKEEKEKFFYKYRFFYKIFVFIFLLIILVSSVNYFVVKPFKKTKGYLSMLSLSPNLAEDSFRVNRKISNFGGSYNEIIFGSLLYSKYLNSSPNIKNNEDKILYVESIDSAILNIKESILVGEENARALYVISDLYQLRNLFIKADSDVISDMQDNGLMAIKLFPRNPRSYFIYSIPLIYSEKYVEALSALNQAKSLNPNISGLKKTILDISRFVDIK